VDGVSRGLRSIIVLSLLLLSVVASSDGANRNPRPRPAPERTTPPVVVSVHDGGFHWADAGVGAAAMLATTLLAVGVALVVRPDLRSKTGRVAASSYRREGS
jgi:hypothetical protein